MLFGGAEQISAALFPCRVSDFGVLLASSRKTNLAYLPFLSLSLLPAAFFRRLDCCLPPAELMLSFQRAL
jgi:hypothetical protein